MFGGGWCEAHMTCVVFLSSVVELEFFRLADVDVG